MEDLEKSVHAAMCELTLSELIVYLNSSSKAEDHACLCLLGSCRNPRLMQQTLLGLSPGLAYRSRRRAPGLGDKIS